MGDLCLRATLGDFNPRSCERSDYIRLYIKVKDFYFNPRSCERSDLMDIQKADNEWNFNPRSCERSDSNNEQIINLFLHIIINIYKFITIPMLISILTCYIFIFLLIIYGANLL